METLATWEFFDWLPTAQRVDSGNYTEYYKACRIVTFWSKQDL